MYQMCWKLVFHHLYSSSFEKKKKKKRSPAQEEFVYVDDSEPLSRHNLKIFSTHIRISLPDCLPSFIENIFPARRDVLDLNLSHIPTIYLEVVFSLLLCLSLQQLTNDLFPSIFLDRISLCNQCCKGFTMYLVDWKSKPIYTDHLSTGWEWI